MLLCFLVAEPIARGSGLPARGSGALEFLPLDWSPPGFVDRSQPPDLRGPLPRVQYIPGVLYLLSACWQSPHPHLIPLHAKSAQRTTTHDVVDLGESGSRGHLLSGWGADETDPDGITYAWTTDQIAQLDFSTDAQHPIKVSFRARAYEFEGPVSYTHLTLPTIQPV